MRQTAVHRKIDVEIRSKAELQLRVWVKSLDRGGNLHRMRKVRLILAQLPKRDSRLAKKLVASEGISKGEVEEMGREKGEREKVSRDSM